MKRTTNLVLTAAMLSATLALGSIQVLAAENSPISVTALATMETPYHQVTALFIQYPEEVFHPQKEDFMVMDYQTFNYTEIYECRPYQEGVITNVYCNDVPETREDKTSEAAKHGKYVVIELEPVTGSYYDEEAGMWRPDNIAGIATVRIDGQSTDHYRTDWSLFVVAQLNNLYDQEGNIVAKRNLLPTIKNGAVSTPEMESFTQESLTSENGKYEIFFNIRLPEGYDESKSYPIAFCQPGAGGSIQYNDQDEEGNFIDIGGNSTRDGLPVNVARYDKEMIVVTVQPWNNTPEDWEVDNVADYIYLVHYVCDNYAVDPSRVYALGNSKGTMMTSQALTREPDLFTAYAQCNGLYMMPDSPQSWFTIYNEEVSVTYSGKTQRQLMELAEKQENRLDEAVVAEYAQPLTALAELEIPIYFFAGTSDEVISPFHAISGYVYLKEYYEAKGYTEEQIDQLVRLDLAEDNEFLDLGVCEFHESTKIIADDNFDVFSWLFSRVKETK